MGQTGKLSQSSSDTPGSSWCTSEHSVACRIHTCQERGEGPGEEQEQSHLHMGRRGCTGDLAGRGSDMWDRCWRSGQHRCRVWRHRRAWEYHSIAVCTRSHSLSMAAPVTLYNQAFVAIMFNFNTYNWWLWNVDCGAFLSFLRNLVTNPLRNFCYLNFFSIDNFASFDISTDLLGLITLLQTLVRPSDEFLMFLILIFARMLSIIPTFSLLFNLAVLKWNSLPQGTNGLKINRWRYNIFLQCL